MGQTNQEQARFLSMGLRSLVETVACLHLIHRRNYLEDSSPLRETYQASDRLAAKLQAMRRTILRELGLREEITEYNIESETPFD